MKRQVDRDLNSKKFISLTQYLSTGLLRCPALKERRAPTLRRVGVSFSSYATVYSVGHRPLKIPDAGLAQGVHNEVRWVNARNWS